MSNKYKDIPQAGDVLSISQGDLRGNMSYLANTLGTSLSATKDHQISINGVDTNTSEGRHLRVSFIDKGALTYPGDGTDAFMFSKTGQIYWGNSSLGAVTQQLTTSNANTVAQQATYGTTAVYTYVGAPAGYTLSAGWTMLPGGLIMQYGTVTSATNFENTDSQITIKFPSIGGANFLFTTKTLNMQATLLSGGGIPHSSGTIAIVQSTLTNQQFQFAYTSGSVIYTGFYWTAIGI